MAPIAMECHRMGIRLLQYLDELLLLASSHQEALDSTQALLHLCTRLGVRVIFDRSSLRPTQEVAFLGVGALSCA